MKIKFYNARICKPAKSGYYLTVDKNGIYGQTTFSAQKNAWGAYDGSDLEPNRMYGPGGDYEIVAWAVFDAAEVLEKMGIGVQK